MKNQDKLFNQIKTAAENAETKDFPSMESVWTRVENKLDKKVLKKENTLWKKIAVAASILLVVSVAYQYFNSDEKLITPKKEMVIIDTTKAIEIQKNQEQVVSAPALNNPINQESTNSTPQKPSPTSQIIINNNYTLSNEKGSGAIITDTAIFTTQNTNTVGFQSKTSFPNRQFESRGVVQKEVEIPISAAERKKESQENTKKQEPLVVVDNTVNGQKLSDVEYDDLETIKVLPDPLYIINGVQYTEQELFGPKPTSPYAPLSKLDIYTISILQEEKATAIYGEKGKKGVVIITTKSGKPEFKK